MLEYSAVRGQCPHWLLNSRYRKKSDGGGGGGGKRRGLGPRNDVLTTCKVVNPRASERPSKAAVRFLMISTLDLSFE